MTLRTIVCDDHPVFREALVTILEGLDGVEVVADVGDGEAAVAAVNEKGADVVLMDLRLPGMSGVEATRLITRDSPSTAVLVLTMSEDDDSVFAALRSGARGYLLKEADKHDISRGLEAVAKGEAVFGPKVAPKVLGFFASAGRHGPAAVPFPQLTDREREVLDLVAHGLDNATIARRLFLSEKTVRNNVTSIMTKLQLTSRAQAVAAARDAGMGEAAP